MPWSNDQFTGQLVIPTGATTGARIEINVNNDGAIKVYDSSNTLVAEISPGADVIKALDAAEAFAKLDPSAPSGIAADPAPGLVLSLPASAGDAEPGSVTIYDDTFDHGIYLRSPSPVADPGASEGDDFAAIRMTGRYTTDPGIQIRAGTISTPNGFVALNDAIMDGNSQFLSYAEAQTYTPSIGGDGAATYSTGPTGWWYRIGTMIFFNAYAVANGAGSGAANVTITAPTNIDRTTRQSVLAGLEGMTAGNNGSGRLVAFTTGSGATFDRLRNSTGANVIGTDIQVGSIIDVTGWYREEL